MDVKQEGEVKLKENVVLEETTNMIDFTASETHKLKVDELLGDLLFHLRQNKAMSTLMICRQIDSIEISEKEAVLCSDRVDLSELVQLERHRSELEQFFKQKGLGFKLKEKRKEKSKADLLREYFGNKLIVE